jgi:transposase
MSNNIQEREARRLDIIDCIGKGVGTMEIAKRLEVPLWTIIGDLKRMQHNRDSKLKDAYSHAREQILVKKQLTANLPGKKFHSMTGMTFQEKTRNNMMFFYRPELWKILKSENQGDAIRELPNSVRKTMKRNGLITSGWKYLEVTDYARACLAETPAVNS